jgi:hypothetical protein
VTITNGYAPFDTNRKAGGAIFCWFASPTITNCVCVGNHADRGGAIAILQSSSTVLDCVISDNFGAVHGGGIYTGTDIGAVPVLTEIVFWSNETSGKGGGIVFNACDAILTNCTFHENEASSGGTVWTLGDSQPLISNTIVSSSLGSRWIYCENGGSATLQCCDVYGNQGGDWVDCIAGQEGINGNMSVDPAFCAPDIGDLSLQSSSPCAPGNHPDGYDCGLIGALPIGCEPRFRILSITDVGNDQGRQVRVKWTKHPMDPSGPEMIVTHYSLWRRVDDYLLSGADHDVPGVGGYMTPPGDWDFIMTVPAYGESTYSAVCPTLCDSTIAQGDCWSVFFVRAGTEEPAVFYDTPPDSGQSVDNLCPAPPGNLRWELPDLLAWNESEAEDFDYFTVYGSETADFHQVEVIGYTIETSMDVSGTDYGYYHVTASDFSGNEGDPSTIEAEASSIPGEIDLPARFALRSIHPNPGKAPIRISFDLPRDAAMRLRVFDVTGRLVMSLVDGRRPAGRHVLAWRATDERGRPLAGGVYWVSLEAGDYATTRKLIVLE